jgi:hypothetical protein
MNASIFIFISIFLTLILNTNQVLDVDQLAKAELLMLRVINRLGYPPKKTYTLCQYNSPQRISINTNFLFYFYANNINQEL